MKRKTGIWTVVVATLAMIPLASLAQGHNGGGQGGGAANAQVERGQRDFDRDRLRDRDRLNDGTYQQDRQRIQDRIHTPGTGLQSDEPIYGEQLMSEQERNQYREQLRLIGQDSEKRTQFLAQHKEEMQTRAKARGVDLDNQSGKSQ